MKFIYSGRVLEGGEKRVEGRGENTGNGAWGEGRGRVSKGMRKCVMCPYVSVVSVWRAQRRRRRGRR